MAVAVDQTLEKRAPDPAVRVAHDHFGNVLLLSAGPAVFPEPTPKHPRTGKHDHARAYDGPARGPSKVSHDPLNPVREFRLVRAERKPHIGGSVSLGHIESD